MRWFRFRFLHAWRHQRRQSHQWMVRHPRCARWLAATGCLRAGSEAMARGAAIGLFIGLTPTVGAQIVLMMLFCTLLRGNFLVAFALSWVSNPITMGPLYYGFNQIGEVAFAPLLTPLASLTGVSGNIAEETVTAFLGSLVVAFPAAIIGYAVTLRLIRRRAARRGFGGAAPPFAKPVNPLITSVREISLAGRKLESAVEADPGAD